MESSEIELHCVLILFHEDKAWYLIEFLPKLVEKTEGNPNKPVVNSLV